MTDLSQGGDVAGLSRAKRWPPPRPDASTTNGPPDTTATNDAERGALRLAQARDLTRLGQIGYERPRPASVRAPRPSIGSFSHPTPGWECEDAGRAHPRENARPAKGIHVTGNDLASIDQLLTTTRAVRKRLDLTRPVPREVVLECLRLAIQAPTGGNSQGWRWLVVDDAETARRGRRRCTASAPNPYLDGYRQLVRRSRTPCSTRRSISPTTCTRCRCS